jgi:hypothetical protein
MISFERLDGRRFGRLLVWAFHGKNKNTPMWLCECDCGNQKVLPTYSLTNGFTKSCGCYGKEHPSHLIHGGKGTHLYLTWKSMRERCNTPGCSSYSRYGGRGTKVCDEWSDFVAFRDWALAHGYQRSLTIDRINNHDGYNPANCRWADWITQANNKSINRHISYRGRTQTVAQWARELNISPRLLYGRLSQGWSVTRAIEAPKRVTCRG